MKTRNRFIACLLALCLLAGFCVPAFASGVACVPGNYAQNKSMWVRTAPQTESSQVFVLPKNSVVAVTEILNTYWGLVTYEGQTGWVSLLYSDLLDVELTLAKIPEAVEEMDFDALKAGGIDGVMLCLGHTAYENAERALCENKNFKPLAAAAAQAGLSVGAYYTGSAIVATAAAAEGAFVRDALEASGVTVSYPVFLNVSELPEGTALPEVAAAFAAVLRDVGYRPGVYCTSAQATACPEIENDENGALWLSDTAAAVCPLQAAKIWEYRAAGEAAYTLSRCYYDYPNVIARPCPKDRHVTGETWTTLREPACDVPGVSVRRCTLCRQVMEEKPIAAPGHVPVIDPAVAPACTTSGASEGVHCSVCDRVLVKPQVFPATGHAWVPGEEQDAVTGEITEICTCSACGLKLPRNAQLSLGDVTFDGVVTAEDARLVLRAAVELEDYRKDGVEFAVADINADGVINAEDARLALRIAVELETLVSVRVQLPEATILERIDPNAPAEEDPAEEQPAEEQPAEEQPAEEQPAEEQPAEEQPAEEQPAEEQPAEEQPAPQIVTVKDAAGTELSFAVLAEIEYEGGRYYVLTEAENGAAVGEDTYIAAVSEDAVTGETVLSDVDEDTVLAVFALYEAKNEAA